MCEFLNTGLRLEIVLIPIVNYSYSSTFQVINRGKNNRLSNANALLDGIGLHYVWNYPNNTDRKSFHKCVSYDLLTNVSSHDCIHTVNYFETIYIYK